MPLIWVTGISGAGKSTACSALKARGLPAFDADFDGFNSWAHRVTRHRVHEPPYPVPSGWTDHYAWVIDAAMVEELARTSRLVVTYLCGTVENDVEVWDYFDRVVCLVADDETLRHRLATRTTNHFGKHADELMKILEWNRTFEANYRRFGATIIDATQPVERVVAQLLAITAG